MYLVLRVPRRQVAAGDVVCLGDAVEVDEASLRQCVDTARQETGRHNLAAKHHRSVVT